MTWCSLAYKILLLFNKCHLPLLAPSHLKCQIKSEGHNMKICHSVQWKMFWPGQAGLNISAACQERCIEGKTQLKVHWAALDNRTPWTAAITIVWNTSTAHLNNTFVPIQCIPPSLCLKCQLNPTGVYSRSVIQPFTIQEPPLWSRPDRGGGNHIPKDPSPYMGPKKSSPSSTTWQVENRPLTLQW